MELHRTTAKRASKQPLDCGSTTGRGGDASHITVLEQRVWANNFTASFVCQGWAFECEVAVCRFALPATAPRHPLRATPAGHGTARRTRMLIASVARTEFVSSSRWSASARATSAGSRDNNKGNTVLQRSPAGMLALLLADPYDTCSHATLAFARRADCVWCALPGSRQHTMCAERPQTTAGAWRPWARRSWGRRSWARRRLLGRR